MNYRIMIRIQAWVLALEAVFLVPALIISAVTEDRASVRGFVLTILICLCAALIMSLLTRKAERKFFAREGLVCTGTAWIVLSLAGALPFFLSGKVPNYVDAFFEIVSGLTTTGASILSDVEAIGKGLLYWRSFSHWVGGMGVLVFFLAIIPADGRANGYMLHLLRAESPGPSVNKIVPRMKDTASRLYLMYCGLTVVNIIALLITGMPVFDAFCIAFGTAGTGGFSVLNTGCATYPAAAQIVTTIFMLLFGVNFSVYYLIVMKHYKAAFKDEELRVYFGLVALSIVLIFFNIMKRMPTGMTAGETLIHSSFQVASIVTTTGYSTVDFDLWPSLSKSILMCLMFMGACAGSTGGGIKVSRVMLLVKNLRRNAHQIIHPNEIRVVKVSGQRVPEQTIRNTDSYLAAYVIIIIISYLLLSFDPGEFSSTTNFSAVMATFNNIGPGFDGVGPMRNFGAYTNFSKIIMSIDMLLGRLEIFPILALMPHVHTRKTNASHSREAFYSESNRDDT